MQLFFILSLYFYSYESFASQAIENFLFSQPAPGVRTEALVIAKEGNILYQKFRHGSPATRHLLWSMSKSLSSFMFGIAEGRGYISREDLIYKYFPKEIDALESSHAKKMKELKIKDFLGMASGLNWNEFYEGSPFNSDVVRMLYFETKKSVLNYVLQTPVKHKPGTRFHYSSGDTNVVTAALQRALPQELKQVYPWDFLFTPMEMNATFEVDAQGVFLGSSYAYLTTGDLLKFGQLIVDGGVYKDKQIIPQEYIQYATSLNDPMGKHDRCLKDHSMTYGAQFWLNHECADKRKPFKDAPANLVMMLGHGGQSVFIFPTEKIVAVRIAADDEKALDKNQYAKLILEAYGK